MLLLPIVLCEVGFWIILVAALAARYLLHSRRTAKILLLGIPLIDVLLLILVVLDLKSGAVPDWSHGLGALYLGSSVVFGPDIVRWLDGKFARRFSEPGPCIGSTAYGWELARREWILFAKAVLAGAISAAVLMACVLAVNDAARTEELTDWFPRIGIALAIWAITPASYTLWPKKPPVTTAV